MKYVKFAVIVFALYFLGYVLGPTIAPMLVSEKKIEDPLTGEAKYKGVIYQINIADFKEEALPKTLVMTNGAQIPTLSGEGQVILEKGDIVKFVKLQDGALMVAKPEANGKGVVKVSDTDIFAQLAKAVFEKESALNGNAVAAVTPTVVPISEPTPEPAPIAAVEEPMSAPVSVPVAAPVPAAAPTPAPEPAGGGKLTDEQLIELMKKSIAGGAVKEFTSEQVKEWTANGDETIDGTEYQTGLVAYEAKTIFGVRDVKAKALIKGGKIERWVYAKSGMEIQ